MSETLATWLSYRPGDLLMFAPETYLRLFERLNHELWPGHVLLGVLVLAMLWLGRRPEPVAHRAAGVLLAIAWAAVAWGFFGLYAEINLAAPWLAGVFVAEALALGVIAILGPGLAIDRRGRRAHIGLALTLWGLLGHPLLLIALGRSLAALELFGLAPTPTAISTIGLLLMSRLRHPAPLLALPVLWCLIAALTWWALLTT
ncbi:DUF6064 family protein [Guyparkeria hydrothermalis]|uniref:DUF6064 family protein n=1 Tax=Guyparkeria hydrothermalis TaxID=923 RepID=UPI002021E7DA|nr:DUF6064 family protein [Guyparkeria hydrothermalis]MCL7745026.1 DUF6064 family protein [Guyparkeria hydrothermalis]